MSFTLTKKLFDPDKEKIFQQSLNFHDYYEPDIIARGPEGKLKCPYPKCEWDFLTTYKLQRHLKSHTKEKLFVCDLCSKSFCYRYNLNSHLRTHAKKDREQTISNIVKLKENITLHLFPIKCTHKKCTEAFETEDLLKIHLENHDFKYQCSDCTKRFKKPSRLKLHEATHNNDLRFSCSFEGCEKAFANQQRLSRHILIHENKRQYRCNVAGCTKSFNQGEYLKAHMRTHEEKKKFVCPLTKCGRTFVCAWTLKVHLQRHANFRPYKCDYMECDKSYLTLGNLKAHKKLHESGKFVGSRQKNDNTVKNVNEYMNSQYFEATLSGDISSYQILNQEDLAAATFGELVCNQYIDTRETDTMQLTGEETSVTLSQSFHQTNSDSLMAADIKNIQFQEEFVSSMYVPAVNNFGVFASGHDYEESCLVAAEESETVFLPPCMKQLDDNLPMSDSEIDTFESSMELSTGHLVIDGGYFGASSCMPDHVYSNRNVESSSTVNLQDIR